MNEPTPEELINIINKNQSFFRDTKDKVIFLHLYIEHYINELICYYAKKEIHETLQESLTFDAKIKFLKKIGIIEDDIGKALTSINQVRNFLSHRLILTEQMVWDKLNTLSFSYKLPYKLKDDEERIDLAKEYEKYGFTKLDKLLISAQLLVGILYTKLKRLNGEEVDQLFYPKFEGKDGKEVCWILLWKRTLEKRPDS